MYSSPTKCYDDDLVFNEAQGERIYRGTFEEYSEQEDRCPLNYLVGDIVKFTGLGYRLNPNGCFLIDTSCGDYYRLESMPTNGKPPCHHDNQPTAPNSPWVKIENWKGIGTYNENELFCSETDADARAIALGCTGKHNESLVTNPHGFSPVTFYKPCEDSLTLSLKLHPNYNDVVDAEARAATLDVLARTLKI